MWEGQWLLMLAEGGSEGFDPQFLPRTSSTQLGSEQPEQLLLPLLTYLRDHL